MNLSFDPLHRAAMRKGSQANGLGTFFLPLSNFADQLNDPADRGRDKKVPSSFRSRSTPSSAPTNWIR